MATATPARPQLSDEDLERLLGLVEGADSVELKLTIPETDQRSAVEALDMDPLDAELRQVYFFDTPDLALYKQGVVARARRVQKKGDDSVIKLRPIVPDELADDVRQAPGMTVEVDAMPGGFVCSATMKRALGTTEVREAAKRERKIRKLFSKEQRAFFDSHSPEGIELNDLQILGPINVLKLKFTPPGAIRRMVAEMWLYPDNTRILELSTKCPPREMFETAARARAFLAKRGVKLDGKQQTKTKTALEFFTKPPPRARARRPKATPAPKAAG